MVHLIFYSPSWMMDCDFFSFTAESSLFEGDCSEEIQHELIREHSNEEMIEGMSHVVIMFNCDLG